jgi:F420-non-reducing hydrogenase iron-sulfur subunit
VLADFRQEGQVTELSTRGGEDFRPKILTFSTESISDLGIDLAGSSHMHYSPTALVVTVPCSSSIKPDWILFAVEQGFDGVFVAADGTDCPYLQDCTDRTAKIVEQAQALLKENGYEPARLKMSAICSVCAEPFTRHIRSFYDALKTLPPAKMKGKGG